ncbi:hypothetical protein LSAT2_003056 [Lamellibrachia satsuma]|nr:hypothetical protein LSAT2_003056 [Lamellibrachia satsuma]
MTREGTARLGVLLSRLSVERDAHISEVPHVCFWIDRSLLPLQTTQTIPFVLNFRFNVFTLFSFVTRSCRRGDRGNFRGDKLYGIPYVHKINCGERDDEMVFLR